MIIFSSYVVYFAIIIMHQFLFMFIDIEIEIGFLDPLCMNLSLYYFCEFSLITIIWLL